MATNKRFKAYGGMGFNVWRLDVFHTQKLICYPGNFPE